VFERWQEVTALFLSSKLIYLVAPQELFGSEGVEMAIHFLKKGCDSFYSGVGHNKLILSTVDCVRSEPRRKLKLANRLNLNVIYLRIKHRNECPDHTRPE